ncbi:hypothetical protein PFLUV_G00210400 [Perca fluviatilis]|uniref:Uncharacterized protein n=1 Tax=Perca fluviatilis TaxID=8168 RepID=A0A6A5EQK0_PERFL|nr:hypothetical protein PFLUV_G00210400 [Perca fluviatilis]
MGGRAQRRQNPAVKKEEESCVKSLLPTRGAAETPLLLHVNFRHNIQAEDHIHRWWSSIFSVKHSSVLVEAGEGGVRAVTAQHLKGPQHLPGYGGLVMTHCCR